MYRWQQHVTKGYFVCHVACPNFTLLFSCVLKSMHQQSVVWFSRRFFPCDVGFVSLPPPAGERDPNRAGGTDITGAGAAAANRHRERRNWTTARGDRRYTKVRVHAQGKLSNLLWTMIMRDCIHMISVRSNIFVIWSSLLFIFHFLLEMTHTYSRQQGRSETEEYSSDSESESEDEEELQMILEDLQKQNEELEVRRFTFNWTFNELCPL